MNICIFKDNDDLLSTMYQRLAGEFESPPVSDRPVGIMLSGGSTPLPLFERFATYGNPAAATIHALYTDDRLVNPDSADSNYGNSMAMLCQLGIADQQTHHLDARLTLQEAADAYNASLQNFFDNNGVIALGVLGLGSDGHTCSIFTEEDARRDDCLAFAVPNRLGHDRVTVSRTVLARTQSIIFLASGENKRQTLNALISDPLSIPAGIAVADHPNIEVWTDVQL